MRFAVFVAVGLMVSAASANAQIVGIGDPFITTDGFVCVVVKNNGAASDDAAIQVRRDAPGQIFNADGSPPEQTTCLQTGPIPAGATYIAVFNNLGAGSRNWGYGITVDQDGLCPASGTERVYHIHSDAKQVGSGPAIARAAGTARTETIAAASSDTLQLGTTYPAGVTSIDIIPSVIGAGWVLSGLPTRTNVSSPVADIWTMTAPSGAPCGSYAFLVVDIKNHADQAPLGRLVQKVMVGPVTATVGQTLISGTVNATGPIVFRTTDPSGSVVIGQSTIGATNNDTSAIVEALLGANWPDTGEPLLLAFGIGQTGLELNHPRCTTAAPLRCFVSSDGTGFLELSQATPTRTVRGITFTLSSHNLPGVSAWGMGLATLLMAGAGAFAIRRARHLSVSSAGRA